MRLLGLAVAALIALSGAPAAGAWGGDHCPPGSDVEQYCEQHHHHHHHHHPGDRGGDSGSAYDSGGASL